MYRYISRESCSQFDSLPLTYLTNRPAQRPRSISKSSAPRRRARNSRTPCARICTVRSRPSGKVRFALRAGRRTARRRRRRRASGASSRKLRSRRVTGNARSLPPRRRRRRKRLNPAASDSCDAGASARSGALRRRSRPPTLRRSQAKRLCGAYRVARCAYRLCVQAALPMPRGRAPTPSPCSLTPPPL
jgi:hypothetical protein